jgi:hypothetical protein
MTLHHASAIRGAAALAGALAGALFLAAPSFAYPGSASSGPTLAPSSSDYGDLNGGQMIRGSGDSYGASQTLCPDGAVRFGGYVQSSRDGAQPTTECTSGMHG